MLPRTCVCVCAREREEMCVIVVGEEKEGHTLVTTGLLLEHLYRIVIFHLQLYIEDIKPKN